MKTGKKSFLQRLRVDFRKNWMLYLMLVPVIVYLLIFCYAPMYGVIIASLILVFTNSEGFITQIVNSLSGHTGSLIGDKSCFRAIYVISEIWQNFGWGSIVYLAAITGINPELYEAARIDGANKFKQIIHVTLPGMLSVYNMIVLRTSFESVPESLYESAALDGAGHFTLLTKITLPLSKAALATITLFYAVGKWGEWYNALVYLQKRRDLYPLQMFLRELLVRQEDMDALMSTNVGMASDSVLIGSVKE